MIPMPASKSPPSALWQREPQGARGVRATPVPQSLPPYAPEGSLNRFRGALGKDMMTTSSTSRRELAFLHNFRMRILALLAFKFKSPGSLPAHPDVGQLENQNPGHTNPRKEQEKSMRTQLSPHPMR